MIDTCSGSAVATMLTRVACMPGRWSNVTVISPFVDDHGHRLLDRLARVASRSAYRLLVATRPENAEILRRAIWNRDAVEVVGVPGLHAKAYVARSRDGIGGELIVTSANLTEHGLAHSHELGLHVHGSDPRAAHLIRYVSGLPRTLIHATTPRR